MLSFQDSMFKGDFGEVHYKKLKFDGPVAVAAMVTQGVIFLLLAISVRGSDIEKLPDDFLLGFATSSYQIEGAWNEDGKGLNYFDIIVHSMPGVFNNEDGDVAADSYHKYKEDVAMLKNLGAQVYRFSLSWARILPTGDTDVINQAGIDYYNNLIDELLRNDIQPMITLYHWDLPETLVKIGGWTNPEIVDYFGKFARVAFSNFGDRVKWWITLNEPMNMCMGGYRWLMDPNKFANKNGEYLCSHNALLSHAKAYHLYDNEFRSSQKGRVGISLSGLWYEPKTNSTEDIEAAETRLQFEIGWYAHPIFIGDYPPSMRKMVDANSKAEGFTDSRLPVFDPDNIAFVKGTADFLGLNHYTTFLVSATPPEDTNPSWDNDVGSILTQSPSWTNASISWLKVVPWGFPKLLNWIKNEYGNPPVFITENGYADHGEIQDTTRIRYYREYMQGMLRAVYEDKCHVIGFTAWSLMDNFEWQMGYSVKFGVYYVDFNSPERTRIPKASATFFRQLSATRKIPV